MENEIGSTDSKGFMVEHENKISLAVLRNEFITEFASSFDEPNSLYLLEENVATVHYSISLKKASFLNKAINRQIDLLISSGIVQKFESERLKEIAKSKRREKERAAESKSEVLTMDHLGICFVAILICLGISFVVFLGEFIVHYFTQLFHRFT
jgi:Fe2+ transport system protein B